MLSSEQPQLVDADQWCGDQMHEAQLAELRKMETQKDDIQEKMKKVLLSSWVHQGAHVQPARRRS